MLSVVKPKDKAKDKPNLILWKTQNYFWENPELFLGGTNEMICNDM